jgi:ubiquinone/menaquinone biosynthesis C-methylase UbiE
MTKENIKKIYHMIKMRYSDVTILDYISKNVPIKTTSTMDSIKRAVRISNILYSFLNKMYPNLIPMLSGRYRYLDIGSNNGLITVELRKKLRLPAYCTFGIDVDIFSKQKIIPVPGFNYRSYDGYHIPYDDNYFSLVTCLMVLHHIRHIDDFIQEIYRVMKIGGILLIKEHDAYSTCINWIISLEHIFYDVIDYHEDPSKIYNNYEQYTLSKKKLIKLLENHNFELIGISDTNFVRKYHYYNPTMVFYALFVKK